MDLNTEFFITVGNIDKMPVEMRYNDEGKTSIVLKHDGKETLYGLRNFNDPLDMFYTYMREYTFTVPHLVVFWLDSFLRHYDNSC